MEEWRETHGDDWGCPELPSCWDDSSSADDEVPSFRFAYWYVLIEHVDKAKRAPDRRELKRFAVVKTRMGELGPEHPEGQMKVLFESDDFDQAVAFVDADAATT